MKAQSSSRTAGEPVVAKSYRIVLASMMVCGMATFSPSASAEEAGATSEGSIGAIDVLVDGKPVQQSPIAPCEVDTVPENATPGTGIGNIATFGAGKTNCARNADGTAFARDSGERFESSVLTEYGGPVLRARSFESGCATTDSGSTGSMQLSGVSGFSVPEDIPPNYLVTIPGENEGDPPLAEIVVNEMASPSPPDGSLTMHALHIKPFPQGGPVTGDILVGTARCAPFGG